ncbi:PREDICTED: G-type lectin S-receptor-like serine/threonine-protein kinase At1g11330 isoform X2 [Lupinus angustifolius]|uniref:G-type lectin S-receptor-like serine/threonine-protein kinase At1g11330 isoform X2 n=1 Tax=Lupinus angustifolius TaxID=3871 RepID=UPI00092FC99E|nr:PREDICTED: G-type lectin S-receptor-like serine/threonine-protein kinase At1g11330 isoform X2 [Lupinus angustifolius]
MRFYHFSNLKILIMLSCFIHVGTSLDTISSSQILKDPETLSSNDGLFKLGFFTPTNSTFSYLGIWYDMAKPQVVWVANRDHPLNNSSSGMLKIYKDGNLVVMNEQNQILWSTNVSNIAASNSTTAQLQNSGNLVLQENTSGSMLWQSLQHPCDTLLQQMKLTLNKTNGEKTELTSWRSPQNPSIGEFSASLDRLSMPEVFVWRGEQQYWRSRPWNGQIFLGTPGMNTVYLSGFILGGQDVREDSYYLTYTYPNKSDLLIYMLSPKGTLHEVHWNYEQSNWLESWSSQNSECDVYGMCGTFGSCDPSSSPICSCLRGFEPMNEEEWNKQNWTSGCVRKEPLQCERVTNGSEAGKSDGFLKIQNTKLPDFIQRIPFIDDDCRTKCLENCSCIAYAYDSYIKCMWWTSNLIDMQRFSNGGTDINIQVSYSELDEKKKNTTVIVTTTVIIGTILIVAGAYILWKRTTTIQKKTNQEIQKRNQINSLSNVKLQEVSQYKFDKLAMATNNFHLTNKLGEGGFGPVYKGTLEDGQEIAVKRLSRASGQGLEEFMNEVIVISKLQHLNLVRLLGCCTDGDEKILIYEYMPNRSLDAYMFDPVGEVLNWEKRFKILEGIARGLLYLHRDSRLRIIHRDLKLSNILLDEELNPKISDFGTARIFGRSEDVANTNRVVGTYGYMSPEYVMEGLFSEKSDVFSFGVLLLEIVSRRKNNSFYEDSESLNLLGFAWKMWNDGNITSLIDPQISNPSFHTDILRCIHIGLLCVQELAIERPTMTKVISMLNSETVNLPPPKQPAFIQRQVMLDVESSHISDRLFSINYVSLTKIQAR